MPRRCAEPSRRWRGNPLRPANKALPENHKEKVHQETHPNHEARPSVSPHLDEAVVDDIRDGEDNESGRHFKRSERHLFGFEEISCYQADAKEHAHQHKGQAHGGFFVRHILVFYEVYQALGFATTAKRWRKITKKSQKVKETKRVLRPRKALTGLAWLLITINLPFLF